MRLIDADKINVAHIFHNENGVTNIDEVEAYIDSIKTEIKTAEEMFREIGYKKVREDKLTIIYECVKRYYENNYNERIYIKFPGGKYFKNALVDKVWTSNKGHGGLELNYAEVLACAQLIKEMEGINVSAD